MARSTARRKPYVKRKHVPLVGPAAAAQEMEQAQQQAGAHKLFKKGYALQKRGEAREAVKLHLKGLKLDKDSVFGIKLLAEALAQMGRRHLAIQTYEHALRLAPDDMETHFALGNLAMSMDMLEVAGQFFAIYVNKRPDDAMGYNNLATVWRSQEKFDEAISLLQQIIPEHAESSMLWNTLAAAVYDRDGLDAALTFYEEALRLDQNSSRTLSNLARCMEQKGDFARGIELAERAIEAEKRLAEPKLVLAHCELALGRLDEGWRHYAARFDPQRPGVIHYTHNLPEWQGEDIADKRILVCPEQGIGDEILFASVFAELAERAGECMIGCDPRLVPLFARSFPKAKVGAYVDTHSDAHRFRSMPFAEAEGAPPSDVAIAAGDLMKFFRPTLESFPSRQGFLEADPEQIAFWRARLDALGPGLKVGICWRSGRQNVDRNRHYTSLDQWGPIFSVEGVQFVNLQYDDCAAELAAAKEQHRVTVQVWDDIDLRNDLDAAAALTAAVDVVISPATAVAMTAVGVGTELIGVLRIPPYWAFGLRDTTPLLADSQLFCWPEDGGWDETLADVAGALRRRAQN
jgi:tetratricopeptide (TPR) repeat protein